jgi:hypothetical protein
LSHQSIIEHKEKLTLSKYLLVSIYCNEETLLLFSSDQLAAKEKKVECTLIIGVPSIKSEAANVVHEASFLIIIMVVVVVWKIVSVKRTVIDGKSREMLLQQQRSWISRDGSSWMKRRTQIRRIKY